LSDAGEEEYFRDGMTEDIIMELSKIKDLKVLPRSAVAAYRSIAAQFSMQAIISPPKARDRFCFAAATPKLLRETPESSMPVCVCARS